MARPRSLAIGVLAGTIGAVAWAAVAFADNCSSELDCQQTQTYNTTTTIIATVIGVLIAVISILISQAAGAAAGVGTAATTAAPPPPPLTDPPTQGGMDQALTGSTLGEDAAKYVKDHNVNVVFDTTDGSYWDSAHNRIVINAKNNHDAAQILVHEVNHAEGDAATTAAWNSGSKETWVNTMIGQETQGTVESIQANKQLRDAGKTPPQTFPLENEYNAARDKAIVDYRAANPNATPADVAKAGDAAGYARVKQGFENGEVRASTNGQGYKDYYGNDYDAKHPAPPAGGP